MMQDLKASRDLDERCAMAAPSRTAERATAKDAGTAARRHGLRHVVFGVIIGVAILMWAPRAYHWIRGSEAQATSTPFDLSRLSIPRAEILRGGPPKDGIPSLTHPPVTPIGDAADLSSEDRVIGIDIDGQRRAYPLRLLNYHEIVNDTVGGVPVAVVYCPLCDSVSVVDRRIDGRTLTFGVSGLLHNSNVLMYDREDDALWSQLKFEAVSGPLVGRALDHLPWELTTFGAWRDRHPDSTVVTFETGHQRSYHTSPYESYFEEDGVMFPVKHADDRLPGREPVIGVRSGELTRAYTVAAIRERGGRLEDELPDGRLIVEFRDDGGVAVIRVPEGAQVAHTFWFSWAAFHPKTELVDITDR